MSQAVPMSYSAALSTNNIQAPGSRTTNVQSTTASRPEKGYELRPKTERSTSPTHKLQTSNADERVYVLTLLTDRERHEALRTLRTAYFPRKINELGAHLTLFHALPHSRLESDILPTLRTVASSAQPFNVHTSKPFRLKKGVAMSVPKHEGGQEAQQLHRRLQDPWLAAGFLSEQDQGACRVHYTIMNKVDDEKEVARAMEEVEGQWKGHWGMVERLTLWLYDRGYWKPEREFIFEGSESSEAHAMER